METYQPAIFKGLQASEEHANTQDILFMSLI